MHDLVGDFHKPRGRGVGNWGIRRKSNDRVGVQNAARETVSGSVAIWWNAELRSKMEETLPLYTESKVLLERLGRLKLTAMHTEPCFWGMMAM